MRPPKQIWKEDVLQDSWLSVLQFWVIKQGTHAGLTNNNKKKIYETKPLGITCGPRLGSTLISSTKNTIFVQLEKY